MRNLISKLVKTCVEIQLAIDEPIISKALETKGMDATSREALRGSVRNSLNEVPEIAAKACESVLEFADTPLGIVLAPSFPLLLQKPALSAAEQIFSDPETPRVVRIAAQVIPPLAHPTASILRGMLKFLKVCQSGQFAHQDIHSAEDHAKNLVSSSLGNRLLEQELRGLERLYEEEMIEPRIFGKPLRNRPSLE